MATKSGHEARAAHGLAERVQHGVHMDHVRRDKTLHTSDQVACRCLGRLFHLVGFNLAVVLVKSDLISMFQLEMACFDEIFFVISDSRNS